MKKQALNSLALVAATLVASNAAADAATAVAPTTDTKDLTITPVAKAPKAPSKAEISREIMTRLNKEGKTYEEIIAEMQRVNGYDRQLARGTYKANYVKAGVPAPVEGVKPGKKAKAETPASTDAAPASTEGGEAAPV